MKLSKFGEQLTGDAGIVRLMEDLGDALNVNPNILFLGGGNPAQIPAFETIVADTIKTIACDPAKLHKLIGVYQSPQGAEAFLDALVGYYRTHMGWNITRRNVALANGSQSAFFVFINMLAGTSERGERHLCFPLMPEYLGYADQCVTPGLVYGFRPKIELLDQRWYKYHIDFEHIVLKDNTAAICVSRPTNPTGNVLSLTEMDKLSALAAREKIPLIVDGAYGDPFPGVCYEKTETPWHENMVFVQSLSKLGLPGARTGIVVANESIIEQFVKVNTVMSLTNGNFGPAVASEMLLTGQISTIRDDIILPFYRRHRDAMLASIAHRLAGVDYRIHVAEGAFFVWLWFPALPISSLELYQRCKQRGLLLMPGEPFFFGLDEPWVHAQQCIRLTYCLSESKIDLAISILAEEIGELYS